MRAQPQQRLAEYMWKHACYCRRLCLYVPRNCGVACGVGDGCNAVWTYFVWGIVGDLFRSCLCSAYDFTAQQNLYPPCAWYSKGTTTRASRRTHAVVCHGRNDTFACVLNVCVMLVLFRHPFLLPSFERKLCLRLPTRLTF